jgi:NADH:ubiquinone reductase (H+-translocating)
MDRPRLPHRVTVVGGGFGGLYAARSLGIDPEVRLTLVDRRNFHLFQPLLYQVATGALSPGEIAQPLRSVLRRQRNTTVILGEAVGLDPDRHEVLMADGGPIAYDTLIVATGAHHSYFDHPEWATLAPGLKTIEDATEIRRRILIAFEAAEREADLERRREWMTFVVVGGGPTGVELAGALGEIAHDTLKRDFRAIRSGEAKVILVEALDRILPPYPPDSSRSAQRQLERLGVEVRARTRVVEITERSVRVVAGDEDAAPTEIPSRTVLWAAGVRASSFARTVAIATGAEMDRAGRVVVGPELTIPGHPEIFVVGDAAVQPWKPGRPTPGVAQGAIQGGKYSAAVIRRRILNRPVTPFRYSDRGDVAVIGRLSGVTNIGWLGPLGRQSGFPAWALWLGIHILYLIGFSNRLVVLIRWAWSFLTHGRGTRLITGTTLLPPIEEPEPPVLAPIEPGDLPGAESAASAPQPQREPEHVSAPQAAPMPAPAAAPRPAPDAPAGEGGPLEPESR